MRGRSLRADFAGWLRPLPQLEAPRIGVRVLTDRRYVVDVTGTDGPSANGGREWRAKRDPIKVCTYDFPSQAVGKAIPYGVYDIAANEGFVNVGITAEMRSSRSHRSAPGGRTSVRSATPPPRSLQITADSGGGNGNRFRLWKTELQELADETGLTIRVCHFPPGTSRWNQIERRLFCHISQTWRGPLVSYQVIINSIAATTTSAGLKVFARLDQRDYPKKIEVTDAQLAAVNIAPDPFHPEWNYAIAPSTDP